ncbi:hypothetical protein MW290_29550 [Aquincola tertiaricarbonis]|uniref:Uncharacterized protein n=1 Tax=Aquincola tertiaricarbonis TaxID=391953 RepID=A0ABY4S8L3_AQUTE|nr:hypothetical protein [Aquincola tertiaricarbonis]URI09698.1 hypothetical protein MW290_29550 [Aquincola tertiaricarbonis]
MKKLIYSIAALSVSGYCMAQASDSDFIGSYVAKERSGAEFVVLRVIANAGKLMASEGESSSVLFEVELASRQDIQRLLSVLDRPLIAAQLSGLKVRDGSREKIILLKVPLGTVLEREASTTGYVVLGMGPVEVTKR